MLPIQKQAEQYEQYEQYEQAEEARDQAQGERDSIIETLNIPSQSTTHVTAV